MAHDLDSVTRGTQVLFSRKADKQISNEEMIERQRNKLLEYLKSGKKI